MKKIQIVTLALALTFSSVACKSSGSQPSPNQPNQSIAQVEAKDKEVKKGHLCGFITKKGQACTRRVAEGKQYCWQHDGLH